MQKFMFKFFIIFVVGISFLFFSLTFVQSAKMKEQMRNQIETIEASNFSYGGFEVQKPPIPNKKEPPIYIPCVFVALLSSLFIYLLFKYLDKNFITPLFLIENKLKEIEKGNLEVKFETKSENKAIQDTFKTLNSMVLNLVEKEKLQDEFIRNLAHDLRSPVIAQERAIAILKEEFSDHELLDGLMENSETYLKMINLVIEAHNNKDIIIEKSDFNLSSLILAVFNGLKPLAALKNIKLINEVSKDIIVYADYISMNRIIMNLVSNAIENISYDKTIKISAFDTTDKIKIEVSDNGSGLDEEMKTKIFKKHISINKTGKKAVSGLGLSIVKELVEKNEGEIEVESEVEKYTKFIIKLPKKENNV